MRGAILNKMSVVTQMMRSCAKESVAAKLKPLSTVSYNMIKYENGKEVSRTPVGK